MERVFAYRFKIDKAEYIKTGNVYIIDVLKIYCTTVIGCLYRVPKVFPPRWHCFRLDTENSIHHRSYNILTVTNVNRLQSLNLNDFIGDSYFICNNRYRVYVIDKHRLLRAKIASVCTALRS